MEKLTIQDFKERYKDLKQGDVANKVNLSHSTISYLYSGNYPISEKITEAFERGFGITLVEVSNETIEKNNTIDETIKKYEEKILNLQKEKAYNIFSEKFDNMVSTLQKNKKMFFENEALNEQLVLLCDAISETKISKKDESEIQASENKTQPKTRRKTKPVLTEEVEEVKEAEKEKEQAQTLKEIEKENPEPSIEVSNEKQEGEASSEVFVQPFELEDFVDLDEDKDYEETKETLTDEEILLEVDSLSEYDNGEYDDTMDIFDEVY